MAMSETLSACLANLSGILSVCLQSGADGRCVCSRYSQLSQQVCEYGGDFKPGSPTCVPKKYTGYIQLSLNFARARSFGEFDQTFKYCEGTVLRVRSSAPSRLVSQEQSVLSILFCKGTKIVFIGSSTCWLQTWRSLARKKKKKKVFQAESQFLRQPVNRVARKNCLKSRKSQKSRA